MRVETFKASKRIKLSDAMTNNLGLSYNAVQKILRNKDAKVNGKRVSSDLFIESSDEVVVYFSEQLVQNIDVVYQDENIVVVFKKRGIETLSETDFDLKTLLSKQLEKQCYAVHRLDRNTEGLVVFALNERSKQELDEAFKNRTIEKFYLSLVYGSFSKKEDTLVAYLKKDSKNSIVKISDEKESGFEKIITKYRLLKEFDTFSLIEVELVTGKTHQIRAHFAYVGHFVIGDEKYGDSKINKAYKKRYQCLCSHKIVFHFQKQEFLSYLDKKEILLDEKKIDFCRNL